MWVDSMWFYDIAKLYENVHHFCCAFTATYMIDDIGLLAKGYKLNVTTES